VRKQASAYTKNMSQKPPRGPNEAARRVLDQITGEYKSPKTRRARQGAEARTSMLSPERRSEIARRAAQARWESEHHQA
jgi:hypothetical protein